jgi:hypothetical protein
MSWFCLTDDLCQANALSHAMTANLILGRGYAEPVFDAEGPEFRSFEPLPTQTLRSSDASTFKALNLEWAQGQRPGIARGSPSTTTSTCLLSSGGLRTRSCLFSTMQRQHHRQTSEPDHVLDPALRGDAVHNHPQIPTHLGATFPVIWLSTMSQYRKLSDRIRRLALYNTHCTLTVVLPVFEPLLL